MSTSKKHKKNKREIKLRKNIINMHDKDQTPPTENIETNQAEAVINQTELANKEELTNEMMQPQTDQDAALAVNVLPVSETAASESETIQEPEPISVPIPTPTHTETTEDEQAKKLYDFYFGEEVRKNIEEEEEPAAQTEPKDVVMEMAQTIPDDEPDLDETAQQLKDNLENFKTFLPNPEMLKPLQNRTVPPPKKFNPWIIGAFIGVLVAVICLSMLFFSNKEKI